jgi:hypothetical protein
MLETRSSKRVLRVGYRSVAWLCFFGVSCQATLASEASPGGAIYKNRCAECHGANGEGVADEHDEPLYGDRSLAELTKIIAETMPKDDPDKLSSEAAEQVASFVYDTFYTDDARARHKPPRVELSRLTIRQYLNVAADLAGSFRSRSSFDEKRGLSAQYYNARDSRRDKRVLERVDDKIEFSYADKSPDDKIGAEEFSMRWDGSLIAEETGDYEFCVRSENGIRLWINDDDKALIDGWVASGGEVVEHTATIRLLGGRAYPLKLNFFKYKDKSASIALRWKPPHGAWETIPKRNLTPARVATTLVISTPFPPDDSSVGYERGNTISKAWDKATTSAAIEFAEEIVREIDSLADTRPEASDRRERIKAFCHRFAERAFRRPLTDEQKQIFIDLQFEKSADLDAALRRSLLLVLMSPRFLYTELRDSTVDDFDVAARLSFSIWDSIPDEELTKAAAAGQLRNKDQIAQQAQRMLKDPRAKAKVNEFFHHWLPLDAADDISKDPQAFPGFDESVVSDLRTSLQLFLDDVIWSESSDFRQLLLADYWFVNDRLAKFYGLQEVPGDGEFHKVSMDAKERAGIVTHPYLLTALAYHKSSSPIHRGVFATRKLLGRALKPPPMAIQFMDGSFDPKMTMREKVTALTQSNACQTCHSVINPLGFSLENFDAVGRFRSEDKQKPIDPTAVYTSVTGETVTLKSARDLAEFAARSPEAQHGFVDQFFQHAVKQPIRAYGADRLEQMTDSFQQSGYNIQKLLLEAAQVAAADGLPAQ